MLAGRMNFFPGFTERRDTRVYVSEKTYRVHKIIKDIYDIPASISNFIMWLLFRAEFESYPYIGKFDLIPIRLPPTLD